MTFIAKVRPLACGCDAYDPIQRLATVDEALTLALNLVHPLTAMQELPLHYCHGEVLAEAAQAQTMMPPFNNSGMDGYAVRVADFNGTGPWALPVSGRIAAGDLEDTTQELGTACRIFTGAPVPPWADAVIMQEEVERNGQSILVNRPPKRGQNIRLQGEDLHKGSTILFEGARLGPTQIAAAAGAGLLRLRLKVRPKVAILCTGSEVVAQKKDREAGKISDANGPMLSAAVTAAGAELVSVTHVDDCPDRIAKNLKALAANSDMVITTGGVSVGDEDHVKNAVLDAGGRIKLSGVAIKPGKPVTFGRIGEAVFLGLPGNPVAAFVIWTVFGVPMLQKFAGSKRASHVRHCVVADVPLSHKPGRREYRPASLAGNDALGRQVVITESKTQSSRFLPMATSDGLVVIPENVTCVSAGDILEFIPTQT